jgi:NADH-quinone oxidoreductase subunit H
MAIGIKAVLLSTLLIGVLVPLRIRLLGFRDESTPSATGHFAGRPAVGLIRPLARFLDDVSAPARSVSLRTHASLASMIAVLAPFIAWAVIPFGSQVQLGSWSVDLVVANLEVGVLWLLAAGVLSLWAALLGDGSDEARVRGAVMGSSQILGMGLALVALFLVFESLSPIEIVSSQSRTLNIVLPTAEIGLGVRSLELPAWGVVYQPVSFALYLVFGSLALRPMPLDPIRSARDAGASGASIVLLQLAEHLDALVLAGVVAALFLGAGAIPYVPAESIVDAIAEYFGSGLATWLCMVIQVAFFVAKVAVLIPLQIYLARVLQNSRFSTSLRLLWQGLVPVALLNILLTASIVIAQGRGS